MHILKATQVALLLANYVTASLTGVAGGASDSSSSSAVKTKDATMPIPPELLFVRQQNNDAQSCDRCRQRCPSNKMINPNNCRRCVRCPPGTKGDPTSTSCIPGEPDPEKDDGRKEEKEQKYQEKKQREKKKHKQTSYDKKKERERLKFQANEERKRSIESRKKVRRMGRCLPLVAMAEGAVTAAEYADEFFDEAYLESMDLEQYWPPDTPVEPWESDDSDVKWESDEYVDKYVNVGLSNTEGFVTGIVRRVGGRSHLVGSVVARGGGAKLRRSTATTMAILGKRQGILGIFSAIGRTAAKAGGRANSVAGGELLKLANGAIKIGAGRSSKKSFKEQSEGAKKVSENKNWRACLTGGAPVK